jgi:hypothetical protein
MLINQEVRLLANANALLVGKPTEATPHFGRRWRAINTLETNLGGRLRIPAYDPESHGDVGLACRTRECIMQSMMII